jgi:hypothetical protein
MVGEQRNQIHPKLVQLMIQNSSTSDFAAQVTEKIQELQRQVLKHQQELMQARQAYAAIATVTNSNHEVSLQLLSFLLHLSRYLAPLTNTFFLGLFFASHEPTIAYGIYAFME